ncbi:MAG: CDP-diacylglycerol--glycerol-3-phosphate 3-phosphatidyltransferase [Atopobiaceae bacterium]|jgi:CDP-diacylglycerol--glycerol-3-phosphate 3-phosphatidyltransferase|nr:CDP-diacylglycerol--glycerol-3-phosphate 3-phosphatidyltransferase [Atopobiaceae bacterium]MCI2173243.1 CDP-diacylglycerol--glycerol-3-phosphate 3-phosphatidyltransferase [Atopobiaceae bacterium]MCI2207238.1 CDP-diacylglycerol--glycerol-3-phosphate 3-phosphatidyltransferase [Atopobiaceae bacterium]
MSRPSIWTAANIVTCVRVALIPAWLVLAELTPTPDGLTLSWWQLLVAATFGLLALTDKLDGYLARSRGEVTTFGKFLDPIADKLVVVSALLVLLQWGLVDVWVIVVIVAREFLVSGLRMVVATSGTVIAASRLGKWKTATTMGAIAGLLVVRALPFGPFQALLLVVSDIAMLVAVILTAVSGVDYFMKSRDCLFDEEGDR